MAYKFQLGAARLSGSSTFEDPATFESSLGASSLSASAGVSGLTLDIEKAADIGQKLTVVGVSDLDGGIDVNASKFTVSTAGAVVADSTISGAAGTFDALAGTSLALQSGGISAAGAIAGASTIDASGDLTVGSITMSEFTVDSSGNTDVDGTLNVEGVPTFQAGAVFSAGVTTANAIAGATTISGSGALSAGSVTTIGAVTGGKLVVGSADMSETDLEKLDGITNGAVAANKAVVVDGSKDIAGFNNVSGSGDGRFFALDVNSSEVISSALQLKAIASLDSTTEATIEAAIDTLNNLVSAGASGADLAVKGPLDLEEGLKQNGSEILSDAGALGGLTTISGSGAISGLSLDIEKAVDVGQKLTVVGVSDLDGGINVSDTFTVSAAGAVAGATTISGSGFISGLGLDIETQADIAQKLTVHGVSDLDGGINVDDTFTVSAAGAVAGATTISGSGQISGAKLVIDTNGVIGTAGDANLLTLKNNELSVAGAMKAAGAVSGSGTLQIGGAVTLDGTLELNGVADAAADLAADSLYFLDGDGLVKSERLSDYASSLAGSGLSAASGVLSVTANNVSSVVSGSTLSEGYNYVAATATASAGMVLPSTPSVGDFVVLKAGAGVSNSNFIAVNTGDSNHKIDGGAGPIRIESPFGAVSLIYVVANDWRIV